MSGLSIAAYFPFARVKVVSQNVHLDCQPSGTLIRVEPDRRFRPICHDCGRAGTVHSAGLRRMIRDLNFAEAQTFLHVEYRRVWCPTCGKAKVEQLSFADPSKRITHRLGSYIHDLCKLMTVQDVARHLGLDPKTVKAVDKHFLQQDFGQTDYEGLRILAVDEISLRHGQHGYMTVVLDYLTGRVVWMGEGRKAETLNAFFEGMTDEQKQAIEAIAKGHRWQQQLESGEYPGLEDLAHAVGCDRTYVGRILRLTCLAPDIIEAILRGDEPDGLSLEKLRKNLPVRWDEQMERWNKMIWVMQPALASRASVFGEGPLHEVCAKKKWRLTAQTASC